MNMAGLVGVVKDLADAMLHRRPRNATRVFLEGLRKDVRDAFDKKQDPETGQAWAARKTPATHPLLVLSGAMRREALAAADNARQDSRGVLVRLMSPGYGRFHQEGTARMARRRFFGVSPRTRAAARRAYAEDLVQLVVGR